VTLDFWGEFCRKATTDASGVYTITKVGTYDKFAICVDPSANKTSPYISTCSPRSVSSIDGQLTSNVNAQVARGVQISGVVTSIDTGSPISDVAVTVIPESRQYTILDIAIARTNASGAYITRGYPAGQYKLLFDPIKRLDDFPTASNDFLSEYYNDKTSDSNADILTIPVGATALPSINVSLSRGAKIAGTVIDGSTGNPVGYAPIEVSNEFVHTEYIRADGQGNFITRYPLRTGIHDLRVSQYEIPRYLTASQKVTATEGLTTAITVTLTPGAVFHGRLVDEKTQQPVPNALVSIVPSEFTYSALSAATGQYTTTFGFQTGTYLVSAMYRGRLSVSGGEPVYPLFGKVDNVTAVVAQTLEVNISMRAIHLFLPFTPQQRN
jgi:hypothetical protein